MTVLPDLPLDTVHEASREIEIMSDVLKEIATITRNNPLKGFQLVKKIGLKLTREDVAEAVRKPRETALKVALNNIGFALLFGFYDLVDLVNIYDFEEITSFLKSNPGYCKFMSNSFILNNKDLILYILQSDVVKQVPEDVLTRIISIFPELSSLLPLEIFDKIKLYFVNDRRFLLNAPFDRVVSLLDKVSVDL